MKDAEIKNAFFILIWHDSPFSCATIKYDFTVMVIEVYIREDEQVELVFRWSKIFRHRSLLQSKEYWHTFFDPFTDETFLSSRTVVIPVLSMYQILCFGCLLF
mgnify:CR=1 FL=1